MLRCSRVSFAGQIRKFEKHARFCVGLALLPEKKRGHRFLSLSGIGFNFEGENVETRIVAFGGCQPCGAWPRSRPRGCAPVDPAGKWSRRYENDDHKVPHDGASQSGAGKFRRGAKHERFSTPACCVESDSDGPPGRRRRARRYGAHTRMFKPALRSHRRGDNR